MTNTISQPATSLAPTMTVEERREYLMREVTLWVGSLRLDAVLSAEELGQYSGMQKALLLRNGMLVAMIRHCRLHPRADSRPAILALITFLADNNDGICYLSITRMCEILRRSREAITTGIETLEEDGQIGVNRANGLPSSYWPLIPAALADLSTNPTWFVDALSTKPKFRVFGSPQEAIAAAANRSTLPDQCSRLDQYHSGGLDHHPSSGVDQYRSSGLDHPGATGRVDLTATGQVSSNSISISTKKERYIRARQLPLDVHATHATRPSADAGSGADAVQLQFEEFWAAFPPGRKRDKGGALVAFRKIVNGKHTHKASAAELIAAVKRYAASALPEDPKFIPLPTTWLNGGRWMDDLDDQPQRSKYDAI